MLKCMRLGPWRKIKTRDGQSGKVKKIDQVGWLRADHHGTHGDYHIMSSLFYIGIQIKQCRMCNHKKPTTEFYASKHKKRSRDGFQAYCKSCSLMNNRSHIRKAKYDLTDDEYRRILEHQDGVCAICRRAEIAFTNKSDRVRSMAIDHDHETGNVRGLLCTKCNTGLGAFEDDPDLLLAAIEYVKWHSRVIDQ